MASSFPLAMPVPVRAKEVTFDLNRDEEQSRTRGGRVIAVERGEALWQMDFTSGQLVADTLGIWRAWLDRLGSVNPFWGYDPARAYPLAYATGFPTMTRAAGGDFDGTAKIQGVANGVDLTLHYLPAGLVLSPGDYLAFDYGTGGAYHALHRIDVGGIANGSGVLPVEVRPAIRAGWVADAVVNLATPCARMLLVPGTLDPGKITYPVRAQISFQAIQTLGA